MRLARRPAMIFQSLGGSPAHAEPSIPSSPPAYESSLAHTNHRGGDGGLLPTGTRDALRPSTSAGNRCARWCGFLRRVAARDRVVKALPFTGALASDPGKVVTYICARGECRQQSVVGGQ